MEPEQSTESRKLTGGHFASLTVQRFNEGLFLCQGPESMAAPQAQEGKGEDVSRPLGVGFLCRTCSVTQL